MKDIEKMKDQLTPIDVWVTPNILMQRQLTLWESKTKEWHFVPATAKGYVIETAHNSIQGCPTSRGFRLYRPAGLSLSWYCDKHISFRVLSIKAADAWFAKDNTGWTDLLPHHGIVW